MNMVMWISIFSILFFCVCCRFFIRGLLSPLPVINTTGYSKLALKVKRGYTLFAWGILTAVFLGSMVISFYQVFIEL